jgi:chromatin structure-remodeling complex subunit RSC9
VPSEVDWALPRLVLASFDRADAFKLETWIDSVAAFQYWPEKWVEELEKEAALQEVREGRVGAARDVFVLGAIPAWTRDEAVEMRATHSLQVLRNASFTGNNAKLICRATFLGVLERFFALPVPFLLEISLRSPEAFAHILVILQSIIPSLTPFPRIARILTTVIPALLVETRDVAMLHHLIPLLISSLTLPNLPPVPDSLAQHLLYLLTLTPPPNILEYTLDLLISLTLQSAQARQILSLPTFPAHLRTLVMLLEHGARSLQATREAPIGLQGAVHRNPASGAILAEAASRRRTIERDAAGKKLYSGERVLVDVGDKPPQLAPSTKAMLYNMREPRRSITWYVGGMYAW